MVGASIFLHVLAVVVWVGGMFFAYMVLRPVAASQLEPPVRLRQWVGVFGLFFPWVWISIVVILVTGFGLIFGFYGGMGAVKPYIHMMLALGLVMMAIFFHVFFAPYKRLKKAVAAEDWPEGGKQLATIRKLVGLNTLLGVVTVAVGSAGRFMG
jgi:uncharacterized membrane protein